MTQPIRKRNPAATREAILAVADRLFTEKGYAGVSLSDIGRAAGINKSLIHHYFGSKEDLHLAVLRRSFPAYATRLAEYLRPALSATDRIAAGFKAYFRFLAETPGYVRMGMWIALFLENDRERTEAAREEIRVGENSDVDFAREVGGHFVAAIAEDQQAGRLRADLDAADMLSVLFCLAEHWHESRALMGLRMERDLLTDGGDSHYQQAALEILLHGVCPR